MKKKLKKVILQALPFIFTTFLTLGFFSTEVLSASENNQSILIKKVSKSYTNKFCNAIGFGLSKESAMNFSIKENKEVFKNKKNINTINKEELAEEIALSVVEKCGYPISLYGEKGILEFKEYYLSKDKES